MKNFNVEYEYTVRGTVIVEAESKDKAYLDVSITNPDLLGVEYEHLYGPTTGNTEILEVEEF